jgi:hypothetical protein
MIRSVSSFKAVKREAVLARQHQIQNDQVDLPVGQRLAHLLAVAGRRHPIAVLFQEASEQVADLAVVVDHQQVRRGIGGG